MPNNREKIYQIRLECGCVIRTQYRWLLELQNVFFCFTHKGWKDKVGSVTESK